jgi:predicted metal-binding protein
MSEAGQAGRPGQVVVPGSLPGILLSQVRAPALRSHACIGEVVPEPSSTVLHVCVTCKAITEAEECLGQRLFRALEEGLAGMADVELRPVSCLAACDHGCTAAVFRPGKPFGYLLGHLQPQHAADILDYVRRYGASPTGSVMPSRRAPSLANAILSRFPGYGLDLTETHPKESK